MKKTFQEHAIKDHYRQADLEKNIEAAFDRSGREIGDYTDTESMDEFHIRGRSATRELARLADFKKGMRVLDLGCGVGGPARMLAAEFGCFVTGVELVEEYCDAAIMITKRTGQSHMVDFIQGDMMDIAFDSQSFDAAWTLHTIMNIEDKSKLFDTVFRVLKRGGIFALYEICSGSHSPPYFPVPWAGDAAMSFLLKPEALRMRLKKSGFIQLQWQDVSQASVEWFHAMAKAKKSSANELARTGPGISLLMGNAAAEKSKNVFLNLTEDRIRTFFGVFRKPL